MIKDRRVNAHGIARVMNAINKIGFPKLKREVDNSKQTLKYIIWRVEQEAENQGLIL